MIMGLIFYKLIKLKTDKITVLFVLGVFSILLFVFEYKKNESVVKVLSGIGMKKFLNLFEK